MVILLVGLIVLGPDRLPVVARKAGQVLSDLRRVSSGFEAEVRTAMFEAEHPDRYRRDTPAGSIVDPPRPAPTDSVSSKPGDVSPAAETTSPVDEPGESEPPEPTS